MTVGIRVGGGRLGWGTGYSARGPGGVHAGNMRLMRPTRDGDLLIDQSSTNRIILVTLDGAATTQ